MHITRLFHGELELGGKMLNIKKMVTIILDAIGAKIRNKYIRNKTIR